MPPKSKARTTTSLPPLRVPQHSNAQQQQQQQQQQPAPQGRNLTLPSADQVETIMQHHSVQGQLSVQQLAGQANPQQQALMAAQAAMTTAPPPMPQGPQHRPQAQPSQAYHVSAQDQQQQQQHSHQQQQQQVHYGDLATPSQPTTAPTDLVPAGFQSLVVPEDAVNLQFFSNKNGSAWVFLTEAQYHLIVAAQKAGATIDTLQSDIAAAVSAKGVLAAEIADLTTSKDDIQRQISSLRQEKTDLEAAVNMEIGAVEREKKKAEKAKKEAEMAKKEVERLEGERKEKAKKLVEEAAAAEQHLADRSRAEKAKIRKWREDVAADLKRREKSMVLPAAHRTAISKMERELQKLRSEKRSWKLQNYRERIAADEAVLASTDLSIELASLRAAILTLQKRNENLEIGNTRQLNEIARIYAENTELATELAALRRPSLVDRLQDFLARLCRSMRHAVWTEFVVPHMVEAGLEDFLPSRARQ